MNKKRRQTRANLAPYSISRFEQRDGGVYVELEAVPLTECSRSAPMAGRSDDTPHVQKLYADLGSEGGRSSARNKTHCEE